MGQLAFLNYFPPFRLSYHCDVPPTHRAFLSYAHRYQGWVEVLQRNLEAALLHVGAVPHQVFLDTVDLGSGRSWVAQLQAGVSQAEHLNLVMTPEALASPRVEDEWASFMTVRRDWARGHLHLRQERRQRAVHQPHQMQWADFEEHDAAKYRDGLQRLLTGLLGLSPRERLKLPAGLAIPDPPTDALPARLRGGLVSRPTPRLESKPLQLAIASALSLKPAALQGHPSSECAASALQ